MESTHALFDCCCVGSRRIFRQCLLLTAAYYIYNYWRSSIEYLVWFLTPEPASFGKYTIHFIAGGIAGGFLLYWLRSTSRIYYGILEVAFGVSGIAFSATTMTASTYQTSVLQIAAGTYIIVRGLDNIRIGLDAAPAHPLWVVWYNVAKLPFGWINTFRTVYLFYAKPLRGRFRRRELISANTSRLDRLFWLEMHRRLKMPREAAARFRPKWTMPNFHWSVKRNEERLMREGIKAINERLAQIKASAEASSTATAQPPDKT